ncbi:MAG: hypothetical protein GPJ54_01060 [Candidatus Heimdallarchaeota archaeon]|nr:hypothetical protein [Candidatus Heimdallarchaeota archaeon]
MLEIKYKFVSVIGISLSDVEKELIIDSWQTIISDSVKFSQSFYKKLFELDSSAGSLFKSDLRSQQIKFMDSINYLVKRMSDLEEATKQMKKLGLKHKGYSVKSKHYSPFGKALIFCFETHLGELFSEECKIAWSKLYDSVAEFMVKGTKRQ